MTIDRLIIFALTSDEVANFADFPFSAVIDSKISRGDYREVTDVGQIRRALSDQAAEDAAREAVQAATVRYGLEMP